MRQYRKLSRAPVEAEGPALAAPFTYGATAAASLRGALGPLSSTLRGRVLGLSVMPAGPPYLNVGCAGCTEFIVNSQLRQFVDRIDNHEHALVAHHEGVFDSGKGGSDQIGRA